MDSDVLALLTENPEWGLLLAAYARAEAQAAEERAAARQTVALPDSPPPDSVDSEEAAERKQIWVRRIGRVDGLADDRLAPLHGRLIAEGLLQFNLGGRDEGVMYRLTRDARQALTAMPPTETTADLTRAA